MVTNFFLVVLRNESEKALEETNNDIAKIKTQYIRDEQKKKYHIIYDDRDYITLIKHQASMESRIELLNTILNK